VELLRPQMRLEDESGEVVYESSLISVSQDVKTVTG
jgi:hypothetical protein